MAKTKEGYIGAACGDRREDGVIVGEWSISVADDVESNDEFGIRGRPEQAAWYKGFWAAQVQAFEKSAGWVFWTWKCNWINGFDEWRWCYKSAVAAGAIPDDAGSAASLLRDLRADNAQLRELLTEATRELKAIRNSSSDTAGTLRRIDRIGPRYIEEEKIA